MPGSRAFNTIVCLTACVLATGLPVRGQTPPKATDEVAFEPYVAEVISTSLNVRSGPSTNNYKVAVLDTGDRVRVVNDRFGWLAIEPPKTAGSLIALDDMDLGENEVGIVRHDGTRVFAAPIDAKVTADDHHSHPPLDRGTEVKIIETLDNGFVRIEPPAGAHVWVKGEYVQAVPWEALAQEAEAMKRPALTPTKGPAAPSPDVEPAPSESAAPDGDGETTPRLATPEKSESSPAFVEAEPAQGTAEELLAMLRDADDALAKEMEKPLIQRETADLLKRYRALAAQTTDEYTGAYAGKRVEQLEAMGKFIQALQDAQTYSSEIKSHRKNFLTERVSFQPTPAEIEEDYAVVGELRKSFVYDSPLSPRRFRIVVPGSDPAETIAYIEVDKDKAEEVETHLGQTVGIRARSRELHADGVDAVPVFSLEAIDVLESTDGSSSESNS